MKGPHRTQRFRELCAGSAEDACRRPACVACLRCGAPLCDRHVPRADERCASCETHYDATGADADDLLRTESRLLTGVALTAGVGIGLASGLGLLAVAGFTAALFFGAHWFRMLAHLADPDRLGLAGWIERHRRRRFLRERTEPTAQARPLLET